MAFTLSKTVLQRLKFYSAFFSINGAVWFYLSVADDPNPFVVLGAVLPIPLLTALALWKIFSFNYPKGKRQ